MINMEEVQLLHDRHLHKNMAPLSHANGGCCTPPPTLSSVEYSSSSSPSPPSLSPTSRPAFPPSHIYYEKPCSTTQVADGRPLQLQASCDGDFINEPHSNLSMSPHLHCSASAQSPSYTEHSDDLDQPSSATASQSEQHLQRSSSAPNQLPLIDEPSHSHSQELRQSPSSVPPALHPVCPLDPNAREFTPLLQTALIPSRQLLPVMAQRPVNTAHSEVRLSVCYQASVSAVQASRNYSEPDVDTSRTLGLPYPNSSTASPDSNDASANYQHTEAGAPNCYINGEDQQALVQQSALGFPAVSCMGTAYGQHTNGVANSFLSTTLSQNASEISRTIGFLPPLHEGPSPLVCPFNSSILSNSSPMHQIGFSPGMSMAPVLPAPAHIAVAAPYNMHTQNMADIHPQQAALAVYTHKHFHPHYGWKEHISRALLISGLPPHADDCQLRQELMQWGHLRAFDAERLSYGTLSVQFFDLRASRQALRDMQNQHLLRQQRFQQQLHAQNGMQLHTGRMIQSEYADGDATSHRGLLCGNVVWAQYVASSSVPCPDIHNQGTLVLFNVDAEVGLHELRQVFEKYGDIREIREAPTKRQHKFLEYYDTRDAEAAWSALNGEEVCGKCLKIEFSRQGRPGVRKQKNHVGPVQTCVDGLSSTGNAQSVNSIAHMQQIMPALNEKNLSSCGWQGYNPSLHEFNQYEWVHAAGAHYNMPLPRPGRAIIAPTPDLGTKDLCSGIQYGGFLKGSDRGLVQGAIAGPRKRHGGLARPSHKLHHMVMQQDEVCSSEAGAYALTSKITQSRAIRRNASLKGHPHFEYDEREVLLISGQPRTTLMIKNIPNKYSQQMLLSLLDHHCVEHNSQLMDLNEPESAYDFVYLPIDFKNRCNLGYAFVNFTTALATLKFFKIFHAQPWEAFNSRKICEIKYARVQGRSALENHFCNSRFACDTMEFLPVVFVPPRNGLVCPSPTAAAGLMPAKSGRPVSRVVPIQALLGSPPSANCQILAAEAEPCKFNPEGNTLLESSSSISDSETESTIEAETNEHDANVDANGE